MGAGASAEAMPLVKATPSRADGPKSLSNAMLAIAERLTPNIPGSIIKKHTHEPFYRKIAEELKVIAKEGDNYTTIDTYAKYLFLTDKPKFDRLKFVLSVYFSLEQQYYKKLDRRYLVWLTSLMTNKSFPENVKVLTWNYDFQIQLTAELFTKEDISYHNTITRHSPPLIDYYPSLQEDTFTEPNRVSLLHLNGIAGFYHTGNIHHHVFLNNEMNNNGNYLNKLMENEGYCRMHFAWEKEHQAIPIRIIDAMAKDVTILVVIGYSFPFFNREMDMEVYRAFRQYGKLRKIYFQDPNRDGEFLRAQFGYTDDIKIMHVSDTSALYIPFEL